MDINNHPCFNADVRHTTGRIHLAVAPRCNVQCNFCNRKFDCANESRPGVTTSILKPSQALSHLDEIERKIKNIAVVGIAGPGDPFANPEETIETMELVHAKYPDKLLCVSSNGLSLAEYVPRLAALNVSHVTITINAVDLEIGANVYEWVYYNKRTYHGQEGAAILLDKQTQALRLLKTYGIIVKINTVVIPRVNEHHVHEISRYVSALGADIQNCIPLIPVAGTPYAQLTEPSPSDMRLVRAKTSMYIKQMSHCARCRADAIGLLGDDESNRIRKERIERKAQCDFLNKPYIAAASSDGITINRHLGETSQLWIYEYDNGKVKLLEQRAVPTSNPVANRWDVVANILHDCGVLLVSGIGRIPYERLQANGVAVESVNGTISDIAETLFAEGEIPQSALRLNGVCGADSTCRKVKTNCNEQPYN
ncbi:MAG: FeMo cofactor biosynthesis protein NifB [Candidatus Ordinivivax streblomastigis]|uniref:FeMo cofactor biosynthesis protein NifB n=1 Tax=Candidatus Ordinivivax streblomastigis TaxID=2540710 RepID=A0A5M8NVA9_9BACT|nr:MAG: FeMo cofactor biosynthesis protein NifB [Candidatus Ordinivivax streblomastigis]